MPMALNHTAMVPFPPDRKRSRRCDADLSPQEQAMLHDLVGVQGLPVSNVASQLGRTVSQCCASMGLPYDNEAEPEPGPQHPTTKRVTRQEWSVYDDMLLAEAVATHGAQWGLIQRLHFPHRTTRTLTYRWRQVAAMLQTARAEEMSRGSVPADVRTLLERHHRSSASSRRTNQEAWAQQVASSLIAPTTPPAAARQVLRTTPSQTSSASTTVSTVATVRSAGSVSPPVKDLPLVPEEKPLAMRPVSVLPSRIQYTVDEPPSGHGGFGGASRKLDDTDIALTGEQVVSFVQRVVEMHADPPPADEDDGLYRAATAVGTLMEHLEMPRPADQQEVVARELLQRNFCAFTEAEPQTATHTALAGLRAFTDQADDPEGSLALHSRKAVPVTEPTGALVRRWDAESVAPSFDVAAQVRRQAVRNESAADEVVASAPPPGASFVSRATTSAFYTAWANMEVTGALHTPSWTNVWEPPRCVVGGVLPRCIMKSLPLPCVYLRSTPALDVSSEMSAPSTMALVAAAVTGKLCRAMETLCPFRHRQSDAPSPS